MKEKTILLFGLAGAVLLYFFTRTGASALTGVPLTLGTTATNPMSAGLVGLENGFASLGTAISAAFGGTVPAGAGVSSTGAVVSGGASGVNQNAITSGFETGTGSVPQNQAALNLEETLENNAATPIDVSTSDQGYSTTLSAPPATGGDDADFFFGV